MKFVVGCTVALVLAALTLFSGFGFGTLLMPAFALFLRYLWLWPQPRTGFPHAPRSVSAAA